MSAAPAAWAPSRGEIIWINHSPYEGQEMKDEHPMLVSSTQAFNLKTGIVIGFPMTSSEGNATNPFAVAVTAKGKTGYVLAFQPKSFDWKARRARPHPWGSNHLKPLGEALARLDAICGICGV